MKSQRKSQRKGNRHMRLWRKQRHEDVPDVATSLRHIRAHFAALGYPLDEFTDEEIVAVGARVWPFISSREGGGGMPGVGLRRARRVAAQSSRWSRWPTEP